MSENNLKLSDESISQVAKLIQLAILTGTDVVDNLRTLRLVVDGDTLYLNKEYSESFNENLERMLGEVEENASENSEEEFDKAKTTSSSIFSS